MYHLVFLADELAVCLWYAVGPIFSVKNDVYATQTCVKKKKNLWIELYTRLGKKSWFYFGRGEKIKQKVHG